jgi:hypothetical protein
LETEKNLTLSYGLRIEMENHVHNAINLVPRIGVAWGFGSRGKTPKTVLRAGYEWFYTRLGTNYILQTELQDGLNQTALLANAADFYPNIPSLDVLKRRRRQPSIVWAVI